MLTDIVLPQKREMESRLQETYVDRKIPVPWELENDLIKVITGPRRAGKSFYGVHLIQQTGSYGYINFDDERLAAMENYDEIISAVNSVYDHPRYLFFDEIQNLPRWEIFVNRLQRQGFRLLITGSNANLLIRTPIIEAVGVPLSGYVKENRFKLYFFDVGLLGAVSGIAPVTFLNYDFGSYQGYVAENFVAQELRAAGNKTQFCWQGRTAEVEFLLEREGEIVPVEVKSGWVTQSKSLKVYLERYRPPMAYVLSANNITQRNTVRYLPLYAAGRLKDRDSASF